MNWLLWREWRLSRVVLIVAAALLVLPYVFMFGDLWWNDFLGSHLARGLVHAATFSLALSQLTTALLGGNAMAGERADSFGGIRRILAAATIATLQGAKLVIAFVVTVLIWGITLLVLWLAGSAALRAQLGGKGSTLEYWHALMHVAITGATFFGVSWLISSLQSSPTTAAGVGLLTPVLVIMGVNATAWGTMQELTADAFIGPAYATVCLTLAVLSFLIGTRYYLHRVEP